MRKNRYDQMAIASWYVAPRQRRARAAALNQRARGVAIRCGSASVPPSNAKTKRYPVQRHTPFIDIFAATVIDITYIAFIETMIDIFRRYMY